MRCPALKRFKSRTSIWLGIDCPWSSGNSDEVFNPGFLYIKKKVFVHYYAIYTRIFYDVIKLRHSGEYFLRFVPLPPQLFDETDVANIDLCWALRLNNSVVFFIEINQSL